MSTVKVEKSGFATVMMTCKEKSGEVLFRDGTTISATANGSYRVRGRWAERLRGGGIDRTDGWMRLTGDRLMKR